MIAVQAPGYFLPADHLSLIFFCGRVHWLTDEYYIKQSFRNRAIICDSNGDHALVVPVRHPVWEQAFSNIRFVEGKEWKKKQLKALKTAYNKSPFYEWAEPDLQQFFNRDFPSLVDMNLASFELLCRWFGKKIERVEILKDEKLIKTESIKSTSGKAAYHQVFQDRCGFRQNLSALDLFFNCGRNGIDYLERRAAELLASNQ